MKDKGKTDDELIVFGTTDFQASFKHILYRFKTLTYLFFKGTGM